MKNSPIAPDSTNEYSAPWRDALALFDADLASRGSAERTRRDYGYDVGQFATWCQENGMQPTQVDPRSMRRYAAVLSENGAGASTVGRKLAALRGLYAVLRGHGQTAHN